MGRWSNLISAEEEAAIKKAMEEQKNEQSRGRREVPAGTYNVRIERLEIGETKDKRPMLKAMCRILDGDYKKSCVFFNRVLYGTKNDASMIRSAVEWLESLEPSPEVGSIEYKNMDAFEQLVNDIAEDIEELEYEIMYDPDEFNSIEIESVFE